MLSQGYWLLAVSFAGVNHVGRTALAAHRVHSKHIILRLSPHVEHKRPDESIRICSVCARVCYAKMKLMRDKTVTLILAPMPKMQS